MTFNAGPPVLKLFHTELKVRKIAGTEGVVEMNEIEGIGPKSNNYALIGEGHSRYLPVPYITGIV